MSERHDLKRAFPIPEGYRIYKGAPSDDLNAVHWVVGLQHRMNAVADWLDAVRKTDYIGLECVREPTNKVDPNAIKIIGCSRVRKGGFLGIGGNLIPRQYHIGYVRATAAKQLRADGLLEVATVRFHSIWYGDDPGKVGVNYQLLVPKTSLPYKPLIAEGRRWR